MSANTNADPAHGMHRAAVLGGGTMGLGIAQVLRLAGLDVVLCDADPDLTAAAKLRLRRRTEIQVDTGLISHDALTRIDEVEATYPPEDAVATADLVVEAAPENLALKQTLLEKVSRAAPEEAVIATNTSSYPIDTLAQYVHLPGRFLGMHWFSPPEWVPGVEVVAGTRTSPAVVERCHTLLRSAGKRPTDVASSPAFLANRLQMALFLESVSCLEDGTATAEQIDEVVRNTFGFRLPHYGPFEIADMAGLDVYLSVFKTLEEGLGARFAPPQRLVSLVEAGRYGTKQGGGFRDYSDEDRTRLLRGRDLRYAAMSRFLEEQSARDDEQETLA